MRSSVVWCSTVAVALSLTSRASSAQDKSKSSVEEQASIARRGAGLVVGTWSLVDNPATGNATTDDSPIGEGYFRKGLDKHLALETTFGVWRRVITDPGTSGPFGSPGGKTTVYLVPQMTSLKLYPFTTPQNALEPFISGGAGFTIGITSQSGGGGLVGGSSGGVTGMTAGIGGSLAAGVEWRFSEAFGLTGGWHYTYIQFFDKLAGEEMYRGTGVTAGLTYRFQY
ncbi:MAG TPA: outer membrane beta-barrel protein [Gemmatimonadaceae bacterium]